MRVRRSPGLVKVHRVGPWPGAVRRATSDEDGQAAIMMALLFLGMFLLACFGISVAVLVGAQVSTQRAADAAALAGCLDLPNATAAATSAIKYGASSGGLNATTTKNLESGDGNQTFASGYPTVVSSSATPAGGGTPIANGRIDVVVQRNQPDLLFNSSQTIKAAAACQRKEGGLPVLFALAANGKDTLKVNGKTALDLGTGGIAVNSTCSSGCGGVNEGLDVIGNATVKGAYATTGDGNARVNGTLTLADGVIRGITPDPFSSVSDPTAPATKITVCPSTGTLSPGTYTCSPSLSGNVTFKSGLYWFEKGITFNSATVTGSGVTLFNGCASGSNCSGSSCGSVNINSGTSLWLVPGALSGAGARLLFFQARNCTNTLSIPGDITLGLPPSGTQPCGGQTCGAFYLPSGNVILGPQGSGAQTADSVNVAVVASTLDIHGPITFNNPFIPSGTPSHGDFALVPFP